MRQDRAGVAAVDVPGIDRALWYDEDGHVVEGDPHRDERIVYR
jgi:predicted lipid-binding transport protein (Tim44 family)